MEKTRRLKGLDPLDGPVIGQQTSYYKLAWLYSAADNGGPSRERFIEAVQAEGVALNAGFRGFAGRSQRRCRRSGPLPNSLAAAKATVLLHHPILLAGFDEIDRVAKAMEKVLTNLN